MSFESPTPLAVGMSGILTGKRYRVVGRVVLGVEEDGTVYYWNEYRLLDDSGAEVTLVCEPTDYGLEWRVFTYFDPDPGLTAAKAARMRVGNRLQIDGHDARITLVGESRVYQIDGDAPEGVAVGDTANYFNLDAGNRTLVVSWTGDEVECFRGVDVPANAVAAAFNLPLKGSGSVFGVQRRMESVDDSYSENQSWGALIGAAVLVIGFFVVIAGMNSGGTRPAARVLVVAPARVIVPGEFGRLKDSQYRVDARLTTEVSSVGVSATRYDYTLTGDRRSQAWLTSGTDGKSEEWTFWKPIQPRIPMSAFNAAGMRAGDPVNLGSGKYKVKTLFLQTVLNSESDPLSGPLPPAVIGVFYGFTAVQGDTNLLVRWNQESIAFYEGYSVPVKDVDAAFHPKPKP